MKTAGAAPSEWTVAATPNAGDLSNQLAAMSCVSPTYCVSVGTYEGANKTDYSVAELWNGYSWTVMPNPSPLATGGNLLGVSCTSASRCTAVGQAAGAKALIEVWNGSLWSVATSPSPGSGNNVLAGVSCTSSMACVAVGFSQNTGAYDQTLVESWNGTSWSVVVSPSPGSENNELSAVSCTTSAHCIAVGSYYVGGPGDQTLIESWNGSSWSIVSSPEAANSSNDELLSVSCISSSTCNAVGFYLQYVNQTAVNKTLVETWNGTSWSVVSSPEQGSFDSRLAAVSCISNADCAATGYSFNGSVYATLVESWNGTLWSVVSSPDQGTHSNLLVAASCIASNICVAAGYYNDGTANRTLAESWNGSSWSLAPSTDESPQPNQLEGVSCVSSSDCVAVGDSIDSSTAARTLVESWNGSTWSVVPSPDYSNNNNSLSGVSCTGTTFCMAVGSYSTGSGPQTLAESWNGSTWSVLSTPDPSSSSSSLAGVSCTSTTFCVAAGSYLNGSGVSQNLVESWNGSAWSVVTTPDAGSSNNNLEAVSCVSSTQCTTVGVVQSGSSFESLVEAWNGTSWSIVSSPDPGATETIPLGISCSSSTSCVAVGYYGEGSDTFALFETWNGATWSVRQGQQPGTSNILFGASCTSSTNCVAVGDTTTGAVTQTFVESWNGTTLAAANSGLEPSGISDQLLGISCSGVASCQSVGYFYNGSTFQTLAEWGTVPAPTVTSFTPTSGPVGTKVTITGTNLEAATSVTFNGKAATITKDTSTKLSVKVPAGASTGKIKVTTPGGTATSTTKFKVT